MQRRSCWARFPVAIQPRLLGLRHVEAHPGAEVQQPAGRDVALDLREHPARGLPLTRLLLDVIVRRRARVLGRELLVVREDVELHVTADGAAENVAQGGAELAHVGIRPSEPTSPRTAKCGWRPTGAACGALLDSTRRRPLVATTLAADVPVDPAEVYDRDYFLSELCEGFDEFSDGHGVSHNKSKQVHALAPGPGVRVLDAGCGRGEVLYACANAGAEVAGVDYSQDAVEITRETSPASRTPTSAAATSPTFPGSPARSTASCSRT